jgi:hypothetical protein
MKRKIVAGLGVAAALTSAASVGGAAPKPGFAPGTWVGSGIQKGIFSIVAGDPSPVDGTARFTLTVSKSLQASGSLTLKTRMEVDYSGLRGTVVGTAATVISGTGSDIRFAGPMRLAGTLSDGKVSMPFATTRPLRGRLLITRAGCASVIGTTDSKLAFKWRAVPKQGTPRPRCT